MITFGTLTTAYWKILSPVRLKIIKIGNSAGVILPKDLLAHLGARIGDIISVDVASGRISLTASNPDFVTKQSTAEAIMREDRNILGRLAE